MFVTELNTLGYSRWALCVCDCTEEGGYCVFVTVLGTLGYRGRWALCVCDCA